MNPVTATAEFSLQSPAPGPLQLQRLGVGNRVGQVLVPPTLMTTGVPGAGECSGVLPRAPGPASWLTVPDAWGAQHSHGWIPTPPSLPPALPSSACVPAGARDTRPWGKGSTKAECPAGAGGRWICQSSPWHDAWGCVSLCISLGIFVIECNWGVAPTCVLLCGIMCLDLCPRGL